MLQRKKSVHDLTFAEQLNFVLTNRLPRRGLTKLTRWFSRIKNKTLTRFSIAVWQHFSGDLKLDEAVTQDYESIHDCFTRQLKPGMRHVDNHPDHVVSPSDGIVMSYGQINRDVIWQAKGFPYTLAELIPDADLRADYLDGQYLTLRLTSTMYHRFHAPQDCILKRVLFVPGDMYNVNHAAVKRLEKLYCKNERAVLSIDLKNSGSSILVVPIAAISVASLKLHCLNESLNMDYSGPSDFVFDLPYGRGEELGYFEHGSTIIVLAPKKFNCHSEIQLNKTVRMGEPIFVYANRGETHEHSKRTATSTLG